MRVVFRVLTLAVALSLVGLGVLAYRPQVIDDCGGWTVETCVLNGRKALVFYGPDIKHAGAISAPRIRCDGFSTIQVDHYQAWFAPFSSDSLHVDWPQVMYVDKMPVGIYSIQFYEGGRYVERKKIRLP